MISDVFQTGASTSSPNPASGLCPSIRNGKRQTTTNKSKLEQTNETGINQTSQTEWLHSRALEQLSSMMAVLCALELCMLDGTPVSSSISHPTQPHQTPQTYILTHSSTSNNRASPRRHQSQAPGLRRKRIKHRRAICPG
jgi:hypothetical protein